jgi:hypothetical protein
MLTAYFPMCLALAACSVAGVIAWRACARLGAVGRTSLRWAAIVGLLLAFLQFTPWLARGSNEGEYVCIVCGRSKWTYSWFGLPMVTRDGSPDVGVGPHSDEYARGFPKDSSELGHTWIPVGGHGIGRGGVSCSIVWSGTWFHDLPQIEDRPLAEKCAAKLRAAPLAEACEALRLYDFSSYDTHSPGEHFDAWRAEWRVPHPGWP